MSGTEEHDAAVAAAREHVAAKDGQPLAALPDDYTTTRLHLHRVAEHVLKPKRVLETGNEIALRYTPGGFGTDPWSQGEASGEPGEIRVEGTEIVLVGGSEERRAEIGDLRAEAELVRGETAGIEAGEGIAIDPEAAAAVADCFAFGTVALAALIDAHTDADPEPIRLWPEHFDVATTLGDEGAGSRANYGASPGDDDHPEPYLYVGPWTEQPAGEIWNATAFPGAELNYAELLAAGDQLAAAMEFFSTRFEALGAE